MRKHLLLSILLILGSILCAQNKEHKTYVKDVNSPGSIHQDDLISCVLTMSYYEDENGNWVYDGPFSIVGKERIPYNDTKLGAGDANVLYEMYGNYTNGKLDGKWSLERKYDFKSLKGVKDPYEYKKTGSFVNGIPTGDWDYTFTKNKVESSIHFTIKDGKPVGQFYSQGFEIDCVGSAKDGVLEQYEEKYRGKTERKSVYYKGVDVSVNSEMAKKYADGKISIEELNDNNYFVYKYDIPVLSKVIQYIFSDDFKLIFNKEFLQKSIDKNYWNNDWLSASGSEVLKMQYPFWTATKVNEYIANVERVVYYDYNAGSTNGGKTANYLTWYIENVENIYNSKTPSIKYVQYKKIKAAIDKKKQELYVQEIKQAITQKTSIEELSALMNDKSQQIDLLSEDNKQSVANYYTTKFNELEQKEITLIMEAIKGNFDVKIMDGIIANYPKKPQYKAFSEKSKALIDEALIKQPQAIEASKALCKALDQIVLVSKNKKIVKKPTETLSAEYQANPSNWDVFVGGTSNIAEKIAPFCPMDNYRINSVADYLEDGSFSYIVEWTKIVSKKEQVKYTSVFVVTKDKQHVDLNSFDFSKAENK